MNILTSSFRMFRARSSDRDRRTDSERVDNIMKAIDQAIASAGSERAGLQRRLETATTTAAMNAGTGVDEYVDRDAGQADALRTEENHMRSADRAAAPARAPHRRPQLPPATPAPRNWRIIKPSETPC